MLACNQHHNQLIPTDHDYIHDDLSPPPETCDILIVSCTNNDRKKANKHFKAILPSVYENHEDNDELESEVYSYFASRHAEKAP